MRRFAIPTLLFTSMLFLAACGSSPEQAPATDTQAPTQIPTEAPTATIQPSKTPPQTGPIATANALNSKVTVNAPTPAGGIIVDGPEDYVGLFQQAWNVIASNYVRGNFNGIDWDAVYDEYLPLFEAIEDQEDHWTLMSQFVRELNDDHSRFVPPARMGAEFRIDTADSAEPVAWTGLDIWPAKEDEQLMIWYVCSNGPGAAAGLQRGDVILAIDGQEVIKSGADWAGSDYSAAIYGGESDDEVTLTIQQGPEAAPRDVRVSLGGANGCDGWNYGIVSESPRIGYIRIPNFRRDSAFNIQTAFEALEEETPLDGLILDQRHNPGGNSDESAGLFAEGIVGTVGAMREDSTRTIFRIRGPIEFDEDTPIVVLTDGNSASAADYFPAIMKELGRATIIGMPTAGNTEGIIQFNLSDGTLIRLAVSVLALNDGTSLEGVGVIPDIEVPLGDWGLRDTPFDVQLQAAIDFLSGN